jgi:beta-N-acetylhexosaminidase
VSGDAASIEADAGLYVRVSLYAFRVKNGRLTSLMLLLLVVAFAAACAEPALTTTSAPSTDTTAAATTSSTTEVTPTTSPFLPRVEEIVAGMTLQAKAAQVLLVSFDGVDATSLAKGMFSPAAPGGVLLLGRNVTGAAQLRSLTAALQEAAASAGGPGLFVATDEEGGSVMRVKEGVPGVPAARVLGTTSSPAVALTLAEATATGLLDQGVNMALAPVADVVMRGDSFLYARSFGSEPRLVSDFVAAVTRGYVERGVVTVVKHFPGHGSAPENSHTSVPVSAATRADFETIHLPPFRAAIAAGAQGVMIGHFVAPAFDALHVASQSATIIEDLLRGDLGFEGLAISDDLEMAAAAAGRPGAAGTASAAALGEVAVASLAAGCDLLIVTSTLARQSAIERAIVGAVQSGALSEERLDQAVTRILLVKAEHSVPVPGVTPRN